MKIFLPSFLSIIFLSPSCFSAELAEKIVSYDSHNNVSKQIVPHAGEISYFYDPIDRLSEIRYPDGKSVKYGYDYNSNLTEVTDDHGITTYSYDKLNRLINAQFPENISITYEYDLADRVTKIIYPDREEVKYDYDKRGRLTHVSDIVGTTQYEYDDETNLVTKERLANGIVTEYTYDNFPRITGVTHKKSNGKLIIEYQFAYDNNNNCITVKEITPSEKKTISYSYDKLNRLIEVNYSDGLYEKYVYDGAGNRLSKVTQYESIDYEYDIYNRLIRAGDIHLNYDASGNLIKKTCNGKEISFSYDAAGRLILYDNGNDKVSFAYDGEGRRISKTVNGKKTSFISDPVAPLSRILIEKDERSKTKKRYVYGCSRLFGKAINETQFFLYDQPGKSVSVLVNNAQKTLDTYNYSVFGTRIDKSNFENSYGYAGEEYDEETGLIYLRNRYYDPDIGRFISPDTVLGVLGDPQTLNPYVYVRNNPINYIDPSGLYARKVPLTFYGNFPGARTPTGKSRGGHAWMGGVDADGKEFNQGAWPGHEMHFDEHLNSHCKETVSLTVWVTPEQQMLARRAGNYPHWTLYDNCVDHVTKSLDAIGYPHPSFREAAPLKISDPTIYCKWLINESKHINPRFLPSNDDVTLPSLSSSGFRIGTHENNFLFTPNYGGISLSKTAEVLANITDLQGAVFDQKTEQLVLYGKKDFSLPSMCLDDLAVAVRSVYGLGNKAEQDPGISLDPDPNSPDKKHPRMIATYYGETEKTRFGQIMFEADRLLKNLSIGMTNDTKEKCKAHVDGYHTLGTLYKKEKFAPPEHIRMWFVPAKISLVQSDDGTSMIFDEVRMQVLTESKFRGLNLKDPAAERFANHFTQNYEEYANEFSVLQDLKRLGKITGVIKWIKEQELPFDLSFFKSYIPQFINTPSFTEQISVYEAIGLGGMLSKISGGVTYHLDDNNFIATTNWQANEAKEEILQTRPKEDQFSWDFGRGLTAVAQPFGKTLKIGDVRKSFIDMIFPVRGIVPLALTRTYSSFNEERSGFGLGWDITPAKLRFPTEKRWLQFSDNTVQKLHTEIFVSIEGVECLYRIGGLDTEKKPVYRADGKISRLIGNLDETFSLYRQQEVLLFSRDGRLIRISDKSGIPIDYEYIDEKLVAISSQGKKRISLEYDGSTIISATGIGDKILYYDYTSTGQLKSVRDKDGIITSYTYDKDQHLNAIFDARGNKIFEASYDSYNRAEDKVVNGIQYRQEFGLAEKRARIEGDNNFVLEQSFDEKYRPREIVDSLGRKLELFYPGPFGPEKTLDDKNLEVFYEYNSKGYPVKIKDAYRGERTFDLDDQGNIVREVDGKGLVTGYLYDENERLSTIYRPFIITGLKIINGKTSLQGEESFATTFHYDPVTGGLTSIDFPSGENESFQLDENGLPVKVCYRNGLISKRAYDERLRLVELSELGRTTFFTYDNRDRIIQTSSPFEDITYSYDQNGNVLSRTDTLGLTTSFEYDENDNLVKVIDALGGITSYLYNAHNDLTKINLPNGSSRLIRYDEYERPIALR